ncbi:PEPxxWA-CTERM sorting domain-containing protein [Sandarakinorhabdus sp. AAP62]|uniref:PEPxxWA-CTERM sorting domain-containing protein n=1 Tax=Sandarakinorhabdus sp. AAP62 TaxID=1248916 RepID=UPI00031F0461|nr:PEPxxWA-CTERM sorting domain-containing protein [Sandarakinorhabdus sp. AAP62]
MKPMFLLAACGVLLSSAAPALATDPAFGDPTQTKSARLTERLPRVTVDPGQPGGTPLLTTVGQDFFGPSPTVFGNQPHPDSRIISSFAALGDYDTRLLGRALVPPDTMGAVGTTQFVQLINGGFAVFSKSTGNLLGASTDNGFWNQLGQGATGGDPRILFDHSTDRWIAIGFGAQLRDINIAVSTTADALGEWKATRFEGLAPLCTGCATIADYPTLAMDNNAIYIGTNNFAAATPGGSTLYRGTSLFVLNKAGLFDAGGPTVSGTTFNTPFVNGSQNNDTTRGFAIQGVNSHESDGTGHVVAASAFINGTLAYDILNAGSTTATQSVATLLTTGYDSNAPGRQPGRVPIGSPVPLRNIDVLDDRISGNAWELNGKTYFVHTVTPEGTDFTRVQLVVSDSTTKAIIQVIDIGDGAYDFYQGAIAVSDQRAVIAYNRSGFDPLTGKIGIYANTYRILSDGRIVQLGDPILVKESLTAGYLNGAPELSGTPAGRQRWGDYAAVTLDPVNSSRFWLIGQFADQAYEVSRPGYPAASGFSRWGQWVAQVAVNGVPEPGTWATMLAGFGMIGAIARRRRREGANGFA